MAKRIYVADDEKNICFLIQNFLEKEGFEVRCFEDGESILAACEEQMPDLCILDVMMPGMDGLTVCTRIRQKSHVPIIIVSAKDSPLDRITGITLGSDDYLVKPFSFEELMARVRALTRRSAPTLAPFYTLCDLTLDPNSHTVTRAGREIKLSAKEFALLEYLLRNQGRVLSRENIENNLWNFDYEGGSNAVDVYIRYLRRKIDEAFSPKLIHTVRGVGYVLKEETPQKGE